MTRSAPFPPVLMLALASCGPAGGKPAAHFAEKAAEEAMVLRPGLWSIATTTTVSDPGGGAMPVPAEPPETQEKCLGVKELARPAPEIFLGPDGSCRPRTVDIGNGNISAVMHCPAQQPIAESEMRIWGTYDRESFRISSDRLVFRMNLNTRVEARRIGTCDGDPGS